MIGHQGEVGAAEHAVAGDVGDEQVAHRRELAEHFAERSARADFPAVGRDQRRAVVEPDVEREGQAVGAEAVEHGGEGGGIGQREAADDDARDAGVEDGRDVVGGAEAARDLELEGGASLARLANRSCWRGAPARAPSRSTRWASSAPPAAKSASAAAGSSE